MAPAAGRVGSPAPVHRPQPPSSADLGLVGVADDTHETKIGGRLGRIQPAMIAEDGDHPVLFQPVDPYVSPRWLDPTYPSQLHLDVEVEEIEAAERAVRELGATRLPGHGDNWRVHADPAGKPFCLQSTVG